MNKTQLKDEQLVELYVNGNESCLEILIHRHQKRIYGYLMVIVKDRALADDVFQETFFKVIQTLKTGRYSEKGKFLPWVMRIAHNLTMDHFRSKDKMPTISHIKSSKQDEEVDIFSLLRLSEDSCEHDWVRNEEYAEIKRLVKLLPADQREVLFMRHYLDMSFNEISAATNANLNTALGRMRYALLNLKKMAGQSDVLRAGVD